MTTLNRAPGAPHGSFELKKAVLRTFSSRSNDSVSQDLQHFNLRDWKRLGNWLHASGLALYLLRELEARGIEDVVPPTIVESLRRNRADNLQRSDSLFREFVRINEAFCAAQISYVNVKGFSLVPEYCPDQSLRSQFDLDFQVHPRFVNSCCSIFRDLGYVLTSPMAGILEFKSGEDCFPSVRDFYKPRSQRCAEVHLAPEMPALAWRLYQGFSFPTLTDELIFVYQAQHLAKHLKSEWTRVAWILELRNCIQLRHDDRSFWDRVKLHATNGSVATDVGLALLTLSTVFELPLPTELAFFIERLPQGVQAWIYEYATEAVLSAFPGTKLNLLLLGELDGGAAHQIRRKLVPLRLPGIRTRGEQPKKRVNAALANARYFAFRLSFHLREGLRYLLIARRWSKVRANVHTHLLSAQQSKDPAVQGSGLQSET